MMHRLEKLIQRAFLHFFWVDTKDTINTIEDVFYCSDMVNSTRFYAMMKYSLNNVGRFTW